jgi:shikimate kinase
MKNIYLLGFMGSGKSYFGKLISERFNLQYLDLDQFIEDFVQLSIPQIFNTIGEGGFREKEANLLRKTIYFNQYIISCGGGTPCFHDNMKWIKEHGISIYLKTTEELLYQRLNNQKSGRPLINSMTDDELRNYISLKIIEREKFYMEADYIFMQYENNDTPKDLEKFIEEKLQGSGS